ncbi:MAG: PadR family transcriptional regulator [Ignavibacteriota bacterium]
MTDDYSQFLPLSPAALHILLSLAGEDRHGYGIMQEVARQSEGQYKLGPGTLYDNLQKLETQGLVEASPKPPAHDDPRRRYFRLTSFGRGVLAADIARLDAVVREAHLHLSNPRRGHIMRTLYRSLLWLHPPVFRREYAGEMLWIFDQTARSEGTAALFLDGLGSLARQWLLRSGWWRIALALSLAVLQVIVGGLAALMFGHRHIVESTQGPAVTNIAEFAQPGPIAHLPLTLGILMYLTVLVTGGLVVMVLGLTFWMKSFTVRRARVLRRVH